MNILRRIWEAVKDNLDYYFAPDKRGEGASAQPQPTYGENPHDTYYRKPPLGLASCWNGPNAAERMMNMLSPRMSDSKFGKYLAWMKGRGCTAAHVFLANGADGECAGYAGWNDSDLPVMLLRVQRLRDAGLVVLLVLDKEAAEDGGLSPEENVRSWSTVWEEDREAAPQDISSRIFSLTSANLTMDSNNWVI